MEATANGARAKGTKGIPLPYLRRERQRHGLSMRELEAKSGVSKNTISGLESGERAAQGRTVRRLAETLGVDIERLVG